MPSLSPALRGRPALHPLDRQGQTELRTPLTIPPRWEHLPTPRQAKQERKAKQERNLVLTQGSPAHRQGSPVRQERRRVSKV